MPSRGWRSSRSTSAASSSSERPIVPPAPAEFSSRSQVGPSQRRQRLLEGRRRPLEPGLETIAQVRADVEDDAVRLDRARRRRPCSQERGARLLPDLLVRGGEVDEVEGVADDRPDPGLGARLP